MSEITDWIKKEIKNNKDYIEHNVNCPHCGIKLSIGGTGFAETILGCYDNKKCSYRIEHKQYGYTVDIGREEMLLSRYKNELAVVQMIESLRKMRDEHPVHYDSLVDAEFLIAYDAMKEMYNKTEKAYKILSGNFAWDDNKEDYIKKVKP